MQEGERAFQHREGSPHEDLLTGIHLSEDVDCLLGIIARPFERLANGSSHFLHGLRILIEIFGTGDERNTGDRHIVIGVVERLNGDACCFDDRYGLKAEGDDRIAPSGNDGSILGSRIGADDIHLLEVDASRSA